MEHFPEYLQYLGYFIVKVFFEPENPIPKRAVILFHDYYISIADNSIIIHSGNSLV